MTEKGLTVRYSILQGLYWMLAALSIAYMVPILEDKGFSSMEIGCLNAVRYTVVIVFQPWLASFIDRHAKVFSLQGIIRFMVATGLFATACFWLNNADFAGTLLLFLVFGSTVCCLEPMINSLSVQYLNHGRNVNYTLARSVGAFTWAVFCVLAGNFADCFGAENLLLLQLALLLLIFITLFFMDPVAWSQENTQETHTVWFLLFHFPKYVFFLFACMLIYMGYSMNTIFLIDRVTMLGGTHMDYGLSQFVLAMAELPVMLLFHRCRKHFSLDQMLFFCALFCTLRAFCTACAQSVMGIILAQVLEIFGLTIYYSSNVYFIMENLPEADGIKGMSLLNVVTVGIGEMAASLLGGFIKLSFGVSTLMSVSVVISVIGLFFMILMCHESMIRSFYFHQF